MWLFSVGKMFIPLRRGFPHYCSSKKGNLKISSVVMRVTTRLVGSKTFSTFNKVVAEIPKSGIREVMAKADEIDRAGVFKHKVIRLEVGQPNFPSPAHVNDAACRAIMNGQTAYIPNAGMFSLREAVSNLYYTKHLKINTIPEQIIITTGSMLSVFSLLTAILEPNDECLLPIPGFPNYCQGIAVVGAVPVPYLCHPDDGYLPRLDDIEQLITPKTKCMIICNPGNPTGRNFPAAIVEKMMSIARKHNIFVISDGMLNSQEGEFTIHMIVSFCLAFCQKYIPKLFSTKNTPVQPNMTVTTWTTLSWRWCQACPKVSNIYYVHFMYSLSRCVPFHLNFVH